MTTLRTYTLSAALIAAALLLVVTVAPAQAKGKTPCWKTLINDWYDGRIDGTYPVHCYREALKHLPSDVDAYSSAREDIKQALQIRLTQSVSKRNTSTQTTPSKNNRRQTTTNEDGGQQSSIPPGPGNNSSGGGPKGGSPDTSSPNPGDSGQPGRKRTSPIVPSAGSPDSVPVPLIVLGSIAALLMAAGAAGFLTRRARSKRLQLASAAAVAQRSGDSPPAE